MDDRQPLAQFTTNGFIGNPYSVIIAGTGGGFVLMFMGISAGLPPFALMALLIGGILLVYGYLTGKVQYTLYKHGIHQRIRRFIPYRLSQKESERFIGWKDVRSYKHDHDLSRSSKEYEYIKLYLKKAPGQIWITDQVDRAGFERFRDAFLGLFEEGVRPPEQPVQDNAVSASKIEPANSNELSKIKRKKSFYKTTFARLLTIGFIVLTTWLVFEGQSMGMSTASIYRLRFVLIPGTVYMIFRAFIKSDDVD